MRVCVEKSRLAPLKAVSIPRLELVAAMPAVQLDQLVRKKLNVSGSTAKFWTDSMTVLKYRLENESQHYNTYVAKDVSFIQEA